MRQSRQGLKTYSPCVMRDEDEHDLGKIDNIYDTDPLWVALKNIKFVD